jgi:hypothetical protein
MTRKLSDEQIACAAARLERDGVRVTGRALRAMLRREYGVSGKTERLFAACRQWKAAPNDASGPVGQLQRELLEAQEGRGVALAMRDQALARAERAEARELAHQDRWATEIHALRESVEQLKGERLRRQSLEEQIVRLQRELQALRRRLAGSDH